MLTAADENTAIALDVVLGQTHEASYVEPMFNATTSRVRDIKKAVADKGFDKQVQRQAFSDRNIEPVTPHGSDSTKFDPLDKEAYRSPNMIDRLFGGLKELRRVATRYDKLKQTFLGMTHLVLGFICVKRGLIINKA